MEGANVTAHDLTPTFCMHGQNSEKGLSLPQKTFISVGKKDEGL